MLRSISNLWVRPYAPSQRPTKKVAIVVPLSTKAELTPDEQVSMRHLVHFLGRYDKFFIAPRGLELRFEGFQIKRFSKRFFGSAAAHGLLCYAPGFYRAFADYELMFFYHLDSLVFSDQLEEWCATDIDYIGPPWIQCADSPWVKKPRVGNGGFTLLRVKSALQVLSNRYRQEPETYWLDLFTRNCPRRMIALLEKLEAKVPRCKVIHVPLQAWREMADPGPHMKNVDVFWSDRAVHYLSNFKVASLEEGLRFGFEVAPRLCFEMNHRKLPFGCHAWSRYDRAFWEPYLLPPAARV